MQDGVHCGVVCDLHWPRTACRNGALLCLPVFCILACAQQHTPPSTSSRAAHRALQAEKMELRNSLIARLQQELFTGAELLQGAGEFAAAAHAAATQMMATSAGGACSSSTVTVWTTPVILVNASACYQACYA